MVTIERDSHWGLDWDEAGDEECLLAKCASVKNILITDVFDDATDEEDIFVEDFVIFEDLDDNQVLLTSTYESWSISCFGNLSSIP